GDETLTSFVTRRLGREALERVAQPLVGGIYTADPDRLSLAATMPRFIEMERAERSLILAMWRRQREAAKASTDGSGVRWSLFLTFDPGWQCLVDGMARRRPEGVVRLGEPVRQLERTADGWRIDGHFECDGVVVALPAYGAAGVLHHVDPLFADELVGIPYASSGVLPFAVRRADGPHPPDRFGVGVAHVERRALLAGTFSSLKYPGRAPAEFVLLRAFVGGALQPELLELDDGELLARIRDEFAQLLGLRVQPLLSRIARWPRA